MMRAGLDERGSMKIIATVDFSTTSENLLRCTRDYAKKLDAEVFLIHVEPHKDEDSLEAMDSRLEAIQLEKDAHALEKAGIKVTPVFLEGEPCEGIINEATQRNADLIISGAHGHGHIRYNVLGARPVGHVSEYMLVKSKIPVLIVPDRLRASGKSVDAPAAS